MYWQTQVFTWIASVVAALLGALSARPAGALLATPTIVLFTDGPAPGTSTDITDYTQADFSGYADVAPTFSGVVNFPSGAEGLLGNALFVGDNTSPFVSNVLIGYLVTDGTSAIYGGELFTEPIAIGKTGDFLDLTAVLPLQAIQQVA